MSGKDEKTMDELKQIWQKDHDIRHKAHEDMETEALENPSALGLVGALDPKESTPRPKAKSLFLKPGAPSVGKFSRKLFDEGKKGGRKKRKTRRKKRKKKKRKTKKRRKRKKRKTKKRYRNQRGCKR